MGLWVNNGFPPLWSPHPEFKWLSRGETVRYLGCQVGVDIPKDVQISHLLMTIRKKLMFWSSANLSFAGRIVVANHVLLATIWYIASCWIFSRSCMGQVQRLIRNFLWSGNEGGPARAKVAWSKIILPRHKGGLGIIDPWDQSRALLGKFVIRSLLPNVGPWASLLRR